MSHVYRAKRTYRKIKILCGLKAMNLWGGDLLQQLKTQINIPPMSETNCKVIYSSEKNI